MAVLVHCINFKEPNIMEVTQIFSLPQFFGVKPSWFTIVVWNIEVGEFLRLMLILV